MPDFSSRSTRSEMMDDFSLGPAVIGPVMDELEVINRFLGGHRVFRDAMLRLDLQPGMRISDWGCGGGDSLRDLAAWARRRALALEFEGIDATLTAVRYARDHSRKFPEIAFVHGDVMEDLPGGRRPDVVISSLFTHHFPDAGWVRLIGRMYDRARHAVIINDLHRHWFAYHAIGVLTRALSRSEMVRHDSRLSVLRGFRRGELERLLEQAGIPRYSIEWKWAFRWQIIIHK
ncbi:MAG TPA: methyltransferase domain-containing protein [Sphingobacteriaceae bacterium]